MLSGLFRKCLLLLLMLKCAEAARIFSYQLVGYDSHQRVFHELTGELARHHQLVALTALPHPTPTHNLTEIDVHHPCYTTMEKFFNEMLYGFSNFAVLDYLEFMKRISASFGSVLDLQLRHPQMRNLIEDESQKFDLILIDAILSQGIGLCARFEAPVVLVSAMTLKGTEFRLVGADTNPYFYPDYMFALDRDSSFWQKLYYVYDLARTKLAFHLNRHADDAFLQKQYGPRARSFEELEKHVGMLFLNVHRYWDDNRPVPIGSVLYMGGFHLTPPRSLHQDLEAYLEQAVRGVVVINFGSKLRPSQLPARTLRVFLDVFAQLPYDFLWKWDADELPGKPDNVRIEKRLPLNDLLHHEAVVALVTHGGLLSAHEALAAAVPALCLPVLPDQRTNARQYEKLGVGLHLSIDSLDAEHFKSAIVALVEDKRYRERARAVSRIVSDVREPPLRTAARWAARAAARWAGLAPGPAPGPAPAPAPGLAPAHAHMRLLRCPLADAHWATFYLLDVALAACVCLLAVAVAIAAAVKRLIAVVCTKSREHLSDNK